MMGKKAKKSKNKKQLRKHDPKHTLRSGSMELGHGLPDVKKLRKELLSMTAVLMGRKPSPLPMGRLTLMEVADGYYSRAAEMKMLIQQMEADGLIDRGSRKAGDNGDPLYQFRTGELSTFMEMAKRAADLGSRRLTEDQLRFEMESLGRESRGG